MGYLRIARPQEPDTIRDGGKGGGGGRGRGYLRIARPKRSDPQRPKRLSATTMQNDRCYGGEDRASAKKQLVHSASFSFNSYAE